MNRIKINDTLEFSQIIYGMWRLADGENNGVKSVKDKINLCLEQGITTFDQADIYGDYSAEEMFGLALKEDKSLRNKIDRISNFVVLFEPYLAIALRFGSFIILLNWLYMLGEDKSLTTVL